MARWPRILALILRSGGGADTWRVAGTMAATSSTSDILLNDLAGDGADRRYRQRQTDRAAEPGTDCAAQRIKSDRSSRRAEGCGCRRWIRWQSSVARARARSQWSQRLAQRGAGPGASKRSWAFPPCCSVGSVMPAVGSGTSYAPFRPDPTPKNGEPSAFRPAGR
jgi:hypothetical protein